MGAAYRRLIADPDRLGDLDLVSFGG